MKITLTRTLFLILISIVVYGYSVTAITEYLASSNFFQIQKYKKVEKEIGKMMRRVISHEIGHALGLPHNMAASYAYPVDSLRSGSFTQKNGIAATIMDYARYNYVAQPGDENIRFIP